VKPTKYTYPATLGYDEHSKHYYVLFPDLPGCTTTGDREDEAVRNAHEAMSLHLYSMEEDGDEIPPPSPIIGTKHDDNEAVILVEAIMPSFREKMETKAISRTVTLPAWLDREAKEAGLSYSQILQDGIMQRLRISRTTARRRKTGILA
jgi:predicted RNase H-like HicB family nuclease